MAKVDLHLPKKLDGAVFFTRVELRRGIVPHRHGELELNLVISGRASYRLDDGRYDLARNSLVWLFPGQNHGLINVSDDFGMWVVLFRKRLLREWCREKETKVLLAQKPEERFCRRLNHTNTRQLHRLFAELENCRTDPPRFNAGVAYGLACAWRFYQWADDIDGRQLHPAVDRAAVLIQSGAVEENLDILAAEVGLSPSRLSRLFKEEMGIPLTRFRNRQRLDIFFSLQEENPDDTLLSLALRSGFGSYPQFHRVCKEELGRGPAEI